jgi:hypothetical protein
MLPENVQKLIVNFAGVPGEIPDGVKWWHYLSNRQANAATMLQTPIRGFSEVRCGPTRYVWKCYFDYDTDRRGGHVGTPTRGNG